MPKYKITDRVTGKAVTVSGDSAPTDQESEKIFKDAGLRDHDQRSLGNAVIDGLGNIPSSAGNLVSNIANAVAHPIDTLANTSNAVGGAFSAATGVPVNQSAQDAYGKVSDFIKSRYGSYDALKNTLATDPVGLAADASVLSGGVGTAAKLGGLSKTAEAANTASHFLNPVTPVAAVAKLLTANGGPLLGKILSEGLGATTGVGGQSIRTAFNAGLEGGDKAAALADALRGKTAISDIVDTAKSGITNLKAQRGKDYIAGMAGVNADPTVLSLEPIEQAIGRGNSINSFEGVDLSPKTAGVKKDISDAIEQWKSLPPETFHTAAGLDALKRRIGDIRDAIPFDRPAERAIANNAYSAVRDSIVKQAPGYADTMSDYVNASGQLDDITKTLSLGPNANIDTSIRKLQSALRDNVNTSFGRRQELAQILSDNGAPNLMEKIAGQTLSAPHARGLGYALTGGEVGSLPIMLATGHPLAAAATIPALALQSPRLVGETAFATGKAANLAKALKGVKLPVSKTALAADELGAQNNYQPTPAMLGALLMGAR